MSETVEKKKPTKQKTTMHKWQDKKEIIFVAILPDPSLSKKGCCEDVRGHFYPLLLLYRARRSVSFINSSEGKRKGRREKAEDGR